MISIGKALEIMHSGQVFSIKVVTFDRRRKDRTGQVREYHEAKLVWATAGSLPGDRPPTDFERKISAGGEDEQRRRPNHALHYTRNIRILQGGIQTEMMVKIHPPLIIEFNGQTTCP